VNRRFRITLLGLLLPLGAAAADFSADRSVTMVSVAGDVSSDAHEAILRNTLDRSFPGLQTRLVTSRKTDLPSRWSLVTDLSLRALEQLRSGSVKITGTTVEFRGLSTAPDAWYAALGLLERNLPTQMELVSEVTVMAAARPMSAICRDLFDAALRETRLGFANGSATLGRSSHAALDRILELATDCPRARIHVRAANDENFGRQRAEAVAAYLENHGLPAARLTVGVTDSVPPRRVYLSATL